MRFANLAKKFLLFAKTLRLIAALKIGNIKDEKVKENGQKQAKIHRNRNGNDPKPKSFY